MPNLSPADRVSIEAWLIALGWDGILTDPHSETGATLLTGVQAEFTAAKKNRAAVCTVSNILNVMNSFIRSGVTIATRGEGADVVACKDRIIKKGRQHQEIKDENWQRMQQLGEETSTTCNDYKELRIAQ